MPSPEAESSQSTGTSLLLQRSRGLDTWGPLITLWIVWGTTYMGTSAMVQTMPPLVGSGARYLGAAAVLATLLVIFRGPGILQISRRQLANTVVGGIGIIGIWAALVALALEHIPSGIAALLGATVPAWVILLRLGSGDRVNLLTWTGVAIAILGAGAMVLPGGTEPIAGDSAGTVALWSIVVLIASFTYALFSWRSRGVDLPNKALVSAMFQLLWGGLAVVLVGFLAGERVSIDDYSTVSWAGFGWLILASIVGYGSYTYLLQHAPLSLVSTFAFVNPVVAVLLGWLLLGEPFTRSIIVGLVVVVTGTALVVRGESRAN